MSFFRPFLRSLSGGSGGGLGARQYATFAAVGDSNTDRMTNAANIDGQNAVCYDQRAWAALFEQFNGRRLVSVGPTPANDYKVGILKDRDHGYSGITAHSYINGFTLETVDYTAPIIDAIASNPDLYIVNIGTNDVSDQTTEETISRIRAVWAALVATGKPVIGTDILQRASAHNSETIRDRIIAVNSGLRATWFGDGLLAYRQWDDLVVKDPITGFADGDEYPDNERAVPNADGIHWGMDVSRRLANDLNDFLNPSYTGVSPTIPADGSALWVTPGAYVTGDTGGKDPAWAQQYLDNGGAVTFSKVTDSEGVWQRVNITDERTFGGGFQNEGVYSRLLGDGVTALIGTQCVPTARIRIPAGQNLAGVGISVQCVGAAGVEDWTYHATAPWPFTHVPVSEFDAQIYCDPFTVPAGTTQIWMMLVPGSGTGIFDFQKAGIIKL